MRKEGITIAVAVVAHALFLGGARAIPMPHALLKRLTVNPPMEMEILTGGPGVGAASIAAHVEPTPREAPETQPPAAREEPAPVEPPADDPAPVEEPRAEARVEPEAPLPSKEPASREDGVSARGEPRPAQPAAVAAAPRPNPADEYSSPGESNSGPPSLAGLIPGFGVANQIALDGAAAKAAPTKAPAAPSIDKGKANEVLASTMIGQDRDKGIDLPATGIVVSTVSDATRALPVPHNTRASFEVKLGPGGKVAGVRVMSSSGGDAAQWAGAAKSVAGSLSKKSLSLGAAKGGATIIVSVTVKHVFPTGSSKGADIKPVCANQIINDIVDGVDDKPAKPGSTIPIFTDENGRPCIPVGVGGEADAANIGATKQIQVQATSKVLIAGKEALPEVKAVNTDPMWLPSMKDGPRPVAPQKMRKYKRDKEKKK